MDTKFVIFVFIGTLLLVTIYSSSAFITFAAGSNCTFLKNTDSICVSADKKHAWYCIHDPKTRYVIKCITVAREALGLPPEINDGGGIQESHNTTKVPSTDILKGNGILEGNNNISNDNVKEPKAPKVPEDLGGLNNDGG